MPATNIEAMLAEALNGNASAFSGLSHGIGQLEIDGLAIGVDHNEEQGRLVLWCSIGELPSIVPQEALEFLLEANLLGSRTGGGHIGLYAPARTLLFSLPLDTTALDAPRLANALARFREKAAELIAEVEERRFSLPAALDMPFMANVIWG